MYCPRCSQQASDEVRFCSRCGLPLDAVAELVERGGVLADDMGVAPEAHGTLTPRQRGTRKGALIMVGGVIFSILAIFLTLFKEDFFVLMLPAAIVLTAGLMRMLYGMLLEDDAARRKSAKHAFAPPRESRAERKLPKSRARELSHARAVPASVFTSARADTNDLAAPPSVAESTTQLLEDK